jgi:hypothetical protein
VTIVAKQKTNSLRATDEQRLALAVKPATASQPAHRKRAWLHVVARSIAEGHLAARSRSAIDT